tara:strand:- start:18586 stop:18915 length:330 start_codon:yes stop_codon:yes gene_type:complete
MQLQHLINHETKRSLIDFINTLRIDYKTNIDKQRSLIKGKDFANEIIKIRFMKLRELNQYISKIVNDSDYKASKKIKNPYMFNKFVDKCVINKHSFYQYALHRKYLLNS